MATTRLEFKDSNSSKFWQIEVEDSSHTVTYGRIGTDGTSKTKEFDDQEAAEKDAQKLINSKVKKGYKEASAEGESTGGDGEKLVEILKPLCSTPADEQVLEKLAAKVKTFEENEDGSGTIVFDHEEYDENEIRFQRGGKGKIKYIDNMPKSFCEIAEAVTEFVWDAGGPDGGYSQEGDDPWLVDEFEEDEMEHINKIEANGGITGAFLGGQGNNIFDTTVKLNNGEHGILFISHEGGNGDQIEGIAQYDYKQIFLRLAANSCAGFDYIDDIMLTD